MANKLTQGVRIGDYTIVVDMNAMCDLQDAFGLPDVNAVLQKLNDGLMTKDKDGRQVVDLRTVRTLFRAGLVEHHGEMSDREAGKILNELGTEAVGGAVVEALFASMPEVKEEEEGDREGPNSPQPSKDGTANGAKPVSTQEVSGASHPG